MMLDLAPLSTQQNQLTDALNATFLTYNGNEGILQNDMGNTKIQDANTGNIMGLREGFVPIGMKEHGGVLYIASVNKEGEGEIGTIPSPIIRDFLKDRETITYTPAEDLTNDKVIRISNKLYPGEKFLMSLKITSNGQDVFNKYYDQICYNTNHDLLIFQYPYITVDKDPEDTGTTRKLNIGIYDIKLYTQTKSGICEVPSSLLNKQTYIEKSQPSIDCDKWFLNNSTKTSDIPGYSSNASWYNIDLRKMNQSDLLKTYPSTSQAGYLGAKAVLTSKYIDEFGIIPRKDGLHVPFTVKWYLDDQSTFKYLTYFPGFWYITSTSKYISKLDIRVINETDNVQMQIYQFEFVTQAKVEAKESSVITISDAKVCNATTYKTWGICKFNSRPTSHLCEQQNGGTRKYIITNSNLVTNSNSSKYFESLTAQFKDKKGKWFSDDNQVGGLFYIDLGTDCNKWCRLEVDFYNQFDENIGTYTTKFNPYINDVFGENVYQTIDLPKATNMNMSELFSSQSGTLTSSYPISTPQKQTLVWSANEPTLFDATKITIPTPEKDLTAANIYKNNLYTNYSGDFKYNIKNRRLEVDLQLHSTFSTSKFWTPTDNDFRAIFQDFLKGIDANHGVNRTLSFTLFGFTKDKTLIGDRKNYPTAQQWQKVVFFNGNAYSKKNGVPCYLYKFNDQLNQLKLTRGKIKEFQDETGKVLKTDLKISPKNIGEQTFTFGYYGAGIVNDDKSSIRAGKVLGSSCNNYAHYIDGTVYDISEFEIPTTTLSPKKSLVLNIPHSQTVDAKKSSVGIFLTSDKLQQVTDLEKISATIQCCYDDDQVVIKDAQGSCESLKTEIIRRAQVELTKDNYYIINIIGTSTKIGITFADKPINIFNLPLATNNPDCCAFLFKPSATGQLVITNEVIQDTTTTTPSIPGSLWSGGDIRTLSIEVDGNLSSINSESKIYKVTSIECWVIKELKDNVKSDLYKSLTNLQLATNTIYRLDYINTLLKDAQVDNKPSPLIILPISSCYEEVFYNESTKKSTNYLFRDKSINDVYYRPKTGVYYSFPKVNPNNTVPDNVDIWTYQATGRKDVNSMSASEFPLCKLRAYPGTENTNQTINTYYVKNIWQDAQ